MIASKDAGKTNRNISCAISSPTIILHPEKERCSF